MDILHDDTMAKRKGCAWTIDEDVTAHSRWSEAKLARKLEVHELDDLRAMLSVRGVLPAPEYDDEPTPGPRGLQGGGGKKQRLGMRPTSAAQRVWNAAPAASDGEHREAPADASAPAHAPDLGDSACDASLSMGELMAGDPRAGWYCDLLRRRLGKTILAAPWYMRADSGASRGGVQLAAMCGLHAVNLQ